MARTAVSPYQVQGHVAFVAAQKRRISALVPMTISGEALGRSQCRMRSSCAGATLTQPFVTAPTVSCRKIAEPRPATVGATLYWITAKWRYAVIVQSASLSPSNGGLVPHATWRKRLYVRDAGSSSP